MKTQAPDSQSARTKTPSIGKTLDSAPALDASAKRDRTPKLPGHEAPPPDALQPVEAPIGGRGLY